MPSRFEIRATALEGATVIQRLPIGDDRGFLERMFCQQELQPIVGSSRIEQINRTLTVRRGTVRGLHFQRPPYGETKIISCIKGEIFDVAVDLRPGSNTFLQWHAEILSSENRRSLAIRPGFAHGFQTLRDDCELIYFHTTAFRPDAEGGVDALDRRLGIHWPLPVAERSERDQSHPPIDDRFTGVPPA